VASNNGEMGLRDEIRVSTHGSGGARIDTRHTADNSVEGLAQMAADGLGLPRETFTDAGRYGYEHSCWQTPHSHYA
jgi:hypothetical protein